MQLVIAAPFSGPPGSGNGGYAAGLFAGALPGDEVTLRRPPPLDTPLTAADGAVRDPGGALIAEVGVGAPIDRAVPPVTRAEAAELSASYRGFLGHPSRSCYVCGPDRADGLRIFPGSREAGHTAATWQVPDEVGAPTIWAALDCPGGWTVLAEDRPYLLGRIAVAIRALPKPGSSCVVTGALLGTEGRKALVHSTLYGPSGDELARARATWIAVV